jgi:hypothetical protein
LRALPPGADEKQYAFLLAPGCLLATSGSIPSPNGVSPQPFDNEDEASEKEYKKRQLLLAFVRF